jgi:hypothetical protein
MIRYFGLVLNSILILNQDVFSQNFKITVTKVSVNEDVKINFVLKNNTSSKIIIPKLTNNFEVRTMSYGVPDSIGFFDYSIVFMKNISNKPFGYLQRCYKYDSNYVKRVKCIFDNRSKFQSIFASCYPFTDTLFPYSEKKIEITGNKNVFQCLSKHGKKWQLRLILSEKCLKYFNENQNFASIYTISNIFKVIGL